MPNAMNFKITLAFLADWCGVLFFNFFFRSWSGNPNAQRTIRRTMEMNPRLRVTLPFDVQDQDVVRCAVNENQ